MYRYGHTGGKSPRIRYTPDRTGLVVTASTCSVNEHLDLRLQFVREEMNSSVQDIYTQRSSSKRINKRTNLLSKRNTAADRFLLRAEDVKLERANAVLMQRLAASRLALDEHTVVAASAAKASQSRNVRMTLHKPLRPVQ
jgi:hypothetical protein